MSTRCAYPHGHHSDDLASVHCGHTEPVYVCGYHLFANQPADLWQVVRSSL